MVGGLPTGTANGFAVDPSKPSVMYVAMRNGLFRSPDGGSTWTATDAPKNVATIAVNPRTPSEVYVATTEGRIVRSRDGGVRWEAAR